VKKVITGQQTSVWKYLLLDYLVINYNLWNCFFLQIKRCWVLESSSDSTEELRAILYMYLSIEKSFNQNSSIYLKPFGLKKSLNLYPFSLLKWVRNIFLTFEHRLTHLKNIRSHYFSGQIFLRLTFFSDLKLMLL
jgi:hypothetical protein